MHSQFTAAVLLFRALCEFIAFSGVIFLKVFKTVVNNVDVSNGF